MFLFSRNITNITPGKNIVKKRLRDIGVIDENRTYNICQAPKFSTTHK